VGHGKSVMLPSDVSGFSAQLHANTTSPIHSWPRPLHGLQLSWVGLAQWYISARIYRYILIEIGVIHIICG
jgi:hypothetical protein